MKAFYIRHKATGMFFLDEPFIVLKSGQPLGGDGCAVDNIEDATSYPTRSSATKAGHARGMNGDAWEIVEQNEGRRAA